MSHRGSFKCFFVVHQARCTAPSHCSTPICIVDGLGPQFVFASCHRIAQVQDLLRRGHWVQQFATLDVNNAQTDVLIGSVYLRWFALVRPFHGVRPFDGVRSRVAQQGNIPSRFLLVTTCPVVWTSGSGDVSPT